MGARAGNSRPSFVISIHAVKIFHRFKICLSWGEYTLVAPCSVIYDCYEHNYFP